MKKIYSLFLMVLVAAFSLSAQNYYNGSLSVEMSGISIVEGQATRISLTEDANGTYTFRLPDFRITIGDDVVPCGDIVVEGVARTANGDGSYAIAGSVANLSLAQGAIHAKVDVAGTETATGHMALTITVGWYSQYTDENPITDEDTIIPIDVTFTGDLFNSVTEYYDGKLNVVMSGISIAENQAAQVQLKSIDTDVYMFKLPDFSIAIGDDVVPCGDIIVEGVTRTANGDGSYAIAGSVANLSLAQGAIHAKVDVTGTETAEGNMSLAITVGWYSQYTDDDPNTDEDTIIPIDVTFNGEKTAAVNTVAADNVKVYGTDGAIAVNGFAGRVYVYSVDGRLVATANVGAAAELPMAKGLYVVRAGSKAAKVIVK